MVLTYKIKHNRDLSSELKKAKQIAVFALENRDKLSTKYVSHFGLKSIIANQVLRKYGRNCEAKAVKSVKLTLPSQGVRLEGGDVIIPSLKLTFPFNKEIKKIRQIELDETYAYVACEVEESKQYQTEKHIGVDLNTTGHCAVVAVKETGKVFKLGKKAEHIHKKYKNIRKNLQKKGLYKIVKKIKNREARIIKDLNHKISRKIVDVAVEEKGGVFLEKLQGIRKTKSKRSFRYALNSWSFYQLGKLIEYKALLAGVPLSYVEPAYTSKCCSRCGQIGIRNDKLFKCPFCGHADNADANGAFNIAFVSDSISQLQAERDVCKGNTDTPKRQHRKAL